MWGSGAHFSDFTTYMIRTRTGCLNCRKRRRKCDEAKPLCTLCLKKNDTCQWQLHGGRFHKNSVLSVDLKKFKSVTPKVDTTAKLEVYSDRLIESLRKLKSMAPAKEKTGLEGRETDLDSAETEIQTVAQNLVRGESTDSLTRLLAISPAQNWYEGQISGESPIFSSLLARENSPKLVNATTPRLGLDHILNPRESAKFENGALEKPGELAERMELAQLDNLMEPFMLYLDLHSTLRDYMFTNAAVADIDYERPMPSYLVPILEHVEDTNRSFQELGQRLKNFENENSEIGLSDAQKLLLYQNYLYEIAPWLDMFDFSRTFGTRIPQLAKLNEALLNAIFAISSRQIELTQPGYNKEVTLRLYQAALRELIPPVTKKPTTAMISSCLLLCVLEMMSLSPNDWRYHLEGCAALFKRNGINGFSTELERGLFWCYARMDICAALISDKSTNISHQDWIPKDIEVENSRDLFLNSKSSDMYANYIVFLCCRVLNLISNESKTYDQEWESLWTELIKWQEKCPEEYKSFSEYEDTPFPGILYLAGPAVSSNQLYHMAIIIMTENKPRRFKIEVCEHVVCKIRRERLSNTQILVNYAHLLTSRDPPYGMRKRYAPSVYTTHTSMYEETTMGFDFERWIVKFTLDPFFFCFQVY